MMRLESSREPVFTLGLAFFGGIAATILLAVTGGNSICAERGSR
jgi:hypothetical protein